MTGYADYLFLLSPPQTVIDEVARYKKASAKYIGEFHGVNSPAHISLAHIERQKTFFSEQTISLTEQRVAIMPPVLLHTDGFKFFGHLHDKKTIYAAIRNSPAVDAWFDLMKKNLNIKKGIVPHITVCRNITDEQFKTLWPNFRHKKWMEPFWANELTIAHRDTFEPYAKWRTVKSIAFKGTKSLQYGAGNTIDAKQVNLF